VTGSLARLLSTVSLALCAIVIVSFGIFVVEESKSGSAHQQQELSGAPAPAQAPPAPKEGAIHEAIDEASSAITAPFAGVVSDSNGEWAVRGAKLGLALAIYGFGLGFISRALRVHV
jgi:hypothetical protein